MKQIIIDHKNFLAGVSTSKNTSDGGFSPLSKGIETNRFVTLYGLLCPGRSYTSITENIADNIVATVQAWYDGSSSYFSIGDAGKIYRSTASGLATTLKATDSVKTYNNTQTSMIVYGGKLFITSTTNILMSDFTFAGADPDNDWWTAVAGGAALTDTVPHKMIEFQGVLFIANGNKLCSWNGTTHKDAAFTLPAGWIISDMEITNNQLWIAASLSTIIDANNTPTKIFFWDGYSGSWNRELVVQTPSITSLKELNGIVYFFGGNLLFVCDGYSYRFLHNIGNAPNFNQVASYNGNLYFLWNNGTNYGAACYDVKNNALTYPVYLDTQTAKVLGIIYYDYIDFFHNKIMRCITNEAANSSFYSNYYIFQQAVNVRKIEILFASTLSTNAQYTTYLFNHIGTTLNYRTISYATDGAINAKSYSLDAHVNGFQFLITFNHTACSLIKEIRIHYDGSERTI